MFYNRQGSCKLHMESPSLSLSPEPLDPEQRKGELVCVAGAGGGTRTTTSPHKGVIKLSSPFATIHERSIHTLVLFHAQTLNSLLLNSNCLLEPTSAIGESHTFCTKIKFDNQEVEHSKSPRLRPISFAFVARRFIYHTFLLSITRLVQ